MRTPSKDVYPEHWDVSIGGVLAAGESFADGARREVLEELGVNVELEPLFPFRYQDSRTLVQAMAYQGRHDGPFHLQPEEIVRGEFVSLDEVLVRARQVPFCPDGLAVLGKHLGESLSEL